MSFEDWHNLLYQTIGLHPAVLIPGGFMVVNIADILCFKDPSMPRIQADNLSGRRVSLTRDQVLKARAHHPHYNRDQLADLLGCSEQTVDRRLHGNNIRGGKYASQTRVKLVGGLLEEMAFQASLYLYDRRVWVKDAAWENSKWHTLSYRSVDEFEYVYVFWKPGITEIDRSKLTRDEWSSWASRGVWNIPSVRVNDDHEAKFPLDLARRVIRLYTKPGDMVLDPFVGSGTTAVASIELGRHYIGIDKEPRYVALAEKYCREATRQTEENHNTRP